MGDSSFIINLKKKNMDKKGFVGKKRLFHDSQTLNNVNNNNNNNNINEDSFNSTQNSDNTINSDLVLKDKLYNEGIILSEHTHWINKVLILRYQPNHNLISSSADGLIIIYDNFPHYKPLLKIKLFNESGVTYLTELKNKSIIACSFGVFKQFSLKYNDSKNEFNYEVINYYSICTSYISKCIELNNEDLLFLSQQNNINILKKKINNYNNSENEANENKIKEEYIKQPLINLLKYELCINILQLNDNLLISGNITDPKYNIIENSSNKINNNCIYFYDEDFNIISKIRNIFCTKSQENMVKINSQYVIVGIEISPNELNWNNNKVIALINYINFQIESYYEVENQISALLLHENNLYVGDNKGYIGKYDLKNKEVLFQKEKRVHFYNINSITCDYVSFNDSNQKIFVIITGSNDGKIKIISYFND